MKATIQLGEQEAIATLTAESGIEQAVLRTLSAIPLHLGKNATITIDEGATVIVIRVGDR